MSKRDTFIGEMLVEQNVLSAEQMQTLLKERADQGGTLIELLLSKQAVGERELWEAVSGELDIRFEEKIDSKDVDTTLVGEIPISFAKANSVLPLRETPDGVEVACANPFDLGALDAVQALLGRPVVPIVVPSTAIIDAINAVYERKGGSDELGDKDTQEEEELTDLIDAEDEAPIIRWVNSLFFEAVGHRQKMSLERDTELGEQSVDASLQRFVAGKQIHHHMCRHELESQG